VYDEFSAHMVTRAKNLHVGNGFDAAVEMGPLANSRRVDAFQNYVDGAVGGRGRVRTGGRRNNSRGNFFEPTILESVERTSRIMNEEPFGPVMMLEPFSDFDSMIAEANRLPYGLAAYVYTRSARTVSRITDAVETGMVSITITVSGCRKRHLAGLRTVATVPKAASKRWNLTWSQSPSRIRWRLDSDGQNVAQ
jgi:succinate-semialdehyde dehydrogenase/glutarate-semialdehyde dehydrogenase